MDPWILLRLPILCTKIVVRRFGWKAVLTGWGLSTVLAIWLNYHF